MLCRVKLNPSCKRTIWLSSVSNQKTCKQIRVCIESKQHGSEIQFGSVLILIKKYQCAIASETSMKSDLSKLFIKNILTFSFNISFINS